MRRRRPFFLAPAFALAAVLAGAATPAVAAPPLKADRHEWVRDVRRATARNDAARACAMPQLIRYQSTLALLQRAAQQPDTFTPTAVKGWRLRLLELRRTASGCLGNASGAPKRAALVVTVDLPRDVFSQRLEADAWAQLASTQGSPDAPLVPGLRR